jgi:hypothetical protein
MACKYILRNMTKLQRIFMKNLLLTLIFVLPSLAQASFRDVTGCIDKSGKVLLFEYTYLLKDDDGNMTSIFECSEIDKAGGFHRCAPKMSDIHPIQLRDELDNSKSEGLIVNSSAPEIVAARKLLGSGNEFFQVWVNVEIPSYSKDVPNIQMVCSSEENR